ncbi:MAG TPA: hypothetical protein VFS43_43035 [Polyangiaceae bacterium]|nr:hypothetical protein [Polyangiaceae bacterium]
MRSLVARFSVALLAAALAACAQGRPAPRAPAPPAAPEAAPPPPPPQAPRAELPLGGRELFPRYRLVGFCGTPGAPALGELRGDLGEKAKAIRKYAEKYGDGREILPTFELIAVLVLGLPNDGKYRRRVDFSVVDSYLAAAREAKALLLLNIQPGLSDFMTEVKHFEKYLHEPDVGVALDPEWAMKPGQKPGEYYGRTTGGVINEVAEYMAAIVAQDDLPEKALVYHQFTRASLKDEAAITPHKGVALIKSVDGWGPKWAKIETYNHLVKTLSPGVHVGFKLFFYEDTLKGGKVMTPKEVLALLPEPEYVMYE